MAATGLLALLDDVTTILDDVAAMSKVAAQKTAGLAGDDLAVNAESLTGLDPSRELPIVGKVALGSAANKVVLIPLALAVPPSVITPVLMIGGTYLCYEGVHKVLHRKDAQDEAHESQLVKAVRDGSVSLQEVESKRVRQAILTDVVLSAEIVAVALGSVIEEPLLTRALVLCVIGFGMTVGIYGLVALIVKLDDIGLHLQGTGEEGSGRRRLGRALVDNTPRLMRVISVLGTIAMFLVGGGIIAHGLHLFEALHLHGWVETPGALVVGLLVGGLAFGAVEGVRRLVAAVRGTSNAH